MTIVLASSSSGRLKMLRDAGIDVEPLNPGLDEDPLKEGLRAEGATARDMADILAEAKAMKVARRVPHTLILGADQILVLDDGTQLDKPTNKEEAIAHLAAMSGKTHRLVTAAVIAENAKPVWRIVDTAKLTMRNLSEDYIAAYVEELWEDIRHSVGCYRIEGRGAQLFARIEGSQFTIIGLPLLHICDYLRIRGELPT